MGWISDKITTAVRRVAATRADGLALQRTIDLHAKELRELVAIGVTYGRLAEDLAEVGVISKSTGKPLTGQRVHKMLKTAPAAPAIQAPIGALSTALTNTNSTLSPKQSVSRAGRGLESLVGKGPSNN